MNPTELGVRILVAAALDPTSLKASNHDKEGCVGGPLNKTIIYNLYNLPTWKSTGCGSRGAACGQTENCGDHHCSM